MKIKLKGTGLLPAALFLVIMLAVPVLGAQEEETLNETKYTDTSNVVSVDKAEEVAVYSLKEISGSISNLSEWKDATVELSTIYYDLDGNRSAYSFNVIENNQQAGYIFISATKDNYPVLEFSKGKIPNEIPEFTARSKSLAKERANKIKLENADKKELTVGEMKPLYLGPTFYYVEYTLTDTKGKAKEKVIVDLPFSTVVDFNKSNVSVPVDEKDYFNSTSLQQQQEIRKQDANAKWTTLEKGMAMKTIPAGYASTRIIGYIYDVPYYEQYDQCPGCSPTASAMVLAYWDDQGYPNFPLGLSLVQELADAMDTSDWPRGSGSTWPWDIADGINEVCINHGYDNIVASNDYTLLTWSKTKNEIDAVRPFVINMLDGGAGDGYSQEYNDHSVTCVGYYDGSEDYVYIHDTWDPVYDHYIAYGSWTAALPTWVRPS